MNIEDAKNYVVKTILTGDAKKIAKVIQRFRQVYGKGGSEEKKAITEANKYEPGSWDTETK